jgi:Raf kinase inhibitor-like YbhB/YbcL family protein
MLSPVHQKALRAPKSISLRSPEFQHGSAMPREYSAWGEDVSPPLTWTGIPSHAGALAVVVDDPDAPAGTFTHWTVWNLPTRIGGLERAARIVPLGAIEGRNDAGRDGWCGPEPPSGTHRYVFRVFALDHTLELPPGATPDEVWRALALHTIAWGELVGTFTRP